MHRLFITRDQLTNDVLTLDPKTMHHLRNVCRLSVGDRIECVMNQERLILANITGITDDHVTISILDQWAVAPKRKIAIALIQSLPKQDKFSDICRMCTEIGVSDFYPTLTDYCQVHTLSSQKISRASKILLSASQQSKQDIPPTLHDVMPLRQRLETIANQQNTVYLFADETRQSTPNQWQTPAFQSLLSSHVCRVVLAIGPEGGYSDNDRQTFESFNVTPMYLGPSILRTEHAGFAAINQLDGFLGSYAP